MDGIVFALIAYLLLFPILTLVSKKLAFKHKVLVSASALLFTILCILASLVIPLYQVMIIFTLLLLLSTYFLETKLRPLFLHPSKPPENRSTTENSVISQQEMNERPEPETDVSSEVSEDVQRDDYIEEPFSYPSSSENVYKEMKEVESSPLEEWDDLEKQIKGRYPPSQEGDLMKESGISSSTLTSEEEEEYNRLFFETKN
ncbi:MAG: hypothetical protein ACQEWI_12015 [Bacillota bacterium]